MHSGVVVFAGRKWQQSNNDVIFERHLIWGNVFATNGVRLLSLSACCKPSLGSQLVGSENNDYLLIGLEFS